MGEYEFIGHTADKGFKVVADSMADLFKTSVLGLAELLREDIPLDQESYAVSQNVEVEAQDETALLVDFLSKILTISHIKKTVFTGIDIKKMNNNKISADIFGNKVEYFDEVIKAVTYHQANIRIDKDGKLATNIVFDI